MQVVERLVASRTDGATELKRQLDVADADIALVNKRLDESQGMCSDSLNMMYRKMQEGHNINAMCALQMVLLPWRP